MSTHLWATDPGQRKAEEKDSPAVGERMREEQVFAYLWELDRRLTAWQESPNPTSQRDLDAALKPVTQQRDRLVERMEKAEAWFEDEGTLAADWPPERVNRYQKAEDRWIALLRLYERCELAIREVASAEPAPPPHVQDALVQADIFAGERIAHATTQTA